MAFYRNPLRVFLEKEVKWVRADVLDLGLEARKTIVGCDVIIHLAGQLGSFDRKCKAVNVEGTRNILEAINKNKAVVFVFFSSIDAFGMTGGQVVDEKDIERPDSFYGESKLEAERLIRSYAAENKNFKFVILRLGNVDMEEVLLKFRRAPVLKKLFAGSELGVVRMSRVLSILLRVIERSEYRNLTRFLTEKTVSVGGSRSFFWQMISGLLVMVMRRVGRGGLWFYLLMGGSEKPYRRYSDKIFEELNLR